MSDQSNLLDQILSGQNRNLQVLAAQGLVPLPPDELLPIQVALTGSPDGEIAGHARATLATIDPAVVKPFVESRATERDLRFFGLEAGVAVLAEAVIRRLDVPRDLLVDMAEVIEPDLQEILVHRQDAILERPEILVAFESNPALSNYTKRRIWEYREHLLPRDKVPKKTTAEVLAEADSITDDELAEAIAEVKVKNALEGDDSETLDEEKDLSENDIRQLPVPMRIKFARNASRQLRNFLIRDANAQVAVTVITANSIPDSEVEMIANSRNVCEEVLSEIPKNREWIRKYAIAKALVKNPKTRLPDALRLVPRMAIRDLRDLAKDKNVADGVRQMSLRLYQARR